MKAPSALALVAAIALGAVVSAQHRPIRPPVQRLLGVGNTPAPSAPSGSSDSFFDDTTLHRIDLAMNAKDWQTLKDNYLDNTYYPTDFKADGQPVLRNVGIRSRGTGSRSGVKPGLRVDFDRYTSDQKYLGLKSFVLRNNTQDPSNLHERLGMWLFRRLNLEAPREAATRLYVNDAYAGLFTIVESIDKTFLNRTFSEDTGHLYKYDYPADGTPWYFTDKGTDPAQYVPLPFKPETLESDPQGEFIVQWVQAVNNATASSVQSAVGPYLNLQKFLRHLAVEVFIGDYDGFVGNYGINNFYLYRLTNQPLFTFIAWDKSEAFKAGPESSVFHNINDVGEAQKNRLVSKVLADNALYATFLDALLECARSASELTAGDARGAMELEVEKAYNQIRQAALDDPQKPYTNDEFEGGVNAMRDFAQRRSGLVTTEVNASRR
ncbi:MAG: CotH kinase family protein [Vicinamibacterales bacterium]